MTIRLLHLSDLHLDRAFAAMGCQGDLARRRRQGLREALTAAGHLAAEQDCTAVTIAGDLYEHERAGVDTGRFLADTFASWQPMRVLIAPGNHDALMPGSLYRRVEWPSNVTVFRASRLEPVELVDGVTVWGLAHREPSWQGDPLAESPASGGSGVHLALFHGAELGSRPEGKSVHGPFHAERIRGAGFAAALCGHYHRRRLDTRTGLLYPGTPEPLSFDEQGGRGPVIVEVDGGGDVHFSAHDTNRWSVFTVECESEDCGSVESVIQAVALSCAATGLTDPERTMIRVDLVGAVDCSLSLDAFTVELAVRERLNLAAVKVRDLTTPLFDLESMLIEESTRGSFVRTATAAAEADPDEAALLDDALRYGLMALSGAEIGLR
ncbi:MAG: exonuclease SbcCD subunit D [Gemmatimonadales bacterium]|jgi:DNA repair exonuclease SbcCD nuclease subunit